MPATKHVHLAATAVAQISNLSYRRFPTFTVRHLKTRPITTIPKLVSIYVQPCFENQNGAVFHFVFADFASAAA